MRKASFASRSEAARYAANQRWKGHVKEENDPDNPVTEAGKEAMRLVAGLAGFDETSNSSQRGVATPVFFYEPSAGKNAEFETEEEARNYVEEQKSLNPETVFYLTKGFAMTAEYSKKYPNGFWEVGTAELSIGYVNNDVKPVDPSKPHSWSDIRYVQATPRTSVDPETNTLDVMEVVLGDAEGTERDAMVMNTSPKNPAGLNREGLVRWERSSMEKFSGYAEQNYCSSLGYYASIYAGYGEPFPRPDNSYRIMHKVSESKLEGLGANLVDSLRKAKMAQPTLWRGIGGAHQEEIKNAGKITNESQVGDTFTVGLGATSRSIAAAQFYASPYSYSSEKGIPTLMRIRAGSQGLALSPKMSAYPHDQEVLTGGKFKVIAKEVVNLSQKARRVAEQRAVIADVQRLPSGTKGKSALLAKVQENLKSVLEGSDEELFTIVDVVQVSV